MGNRINDGPILFRTEHTGLITAPNPNPFGFDINFILKSPSNQVDYENKLCRNNVFYIKIKVCLNSISFLEGDCYMLDRPWQFYKC